MPLSNNCFGVGIYRHSGEQIPRVVLTVPKNFQTYGQKWIYDDHHKKITVDNSSEHILPKFSKKCFHFGPPNFQIFYILTY